MTTAWDTLGVALGTVLGAIASAYAVIAWWTTRRRLRDRPEAGSLGNASGAPGVTILKPLYGADPTLYECLRSFCEQQYPALQIVCGVRDPHDPAIAIVERLQREFPQLALDLVIDARQHGGSLKVSNLINMLERARHPVLIISDSDVRVSRRYLASVVAPLGDPGVGIVTCAYRGVPIGSAWSALLAMFINEWFLPCVYVAASLGSQAFTSGVTMAFRRSTLDAIGGFAAIADHLADDYRMGQLSRRQGLSTVLADVLVETSVDERSLIDLVRHQLRWLRTIRIVQPAGYASTFVTFGLPVTMLGCLIARGGGATLALLGVTALVRVLLHFEVGRGAKRVPQLWVLPFNDLLGFALWCWGFVSRSVHWRQARYRVARDGTVEPIL
jgi:ceramide glucosyltransferase